MSFAPGYQVPLYQNASFEDVFGRFEGKSAEERGFAIHEWLRARRDAPFAILDAKLRIVQGAGTALARIDSANNPREFKVHEEHRQKVLMEWATELEEMARSYLGATPADRAREAIRANHVATTVVAAPPPPPPPFDPRGWIEQLEVAGVSIGAAGGKLTLSPVWLLTDDIRADAAAHRAALLEFLDMSTITI